MYFVDTNIFLRILIKSDEVAFHDCHAFLTSLQQKNNSITGGLILAEVAWTLRSFYRYKHDQIAVALNSIHALQGMHIIDFYDYHAALQVYQKKQVKFIDACIASIPKVASKEWTVVSYDRDFDKLGVLRKEPRQLR